MIRELATNHSERQTVYIYVSNPVKSKVTLTTGQDHKVSKSLLPSSGKQLPFKILSKSKLLKIVQ